MIIDARLSRAASFLVLVDGFVPSTPLSVADQLAGTICQPSEGAVYAQPVSQAVAKNRRYPLTPSSTKPALLPTSMACRARYQAGDRSFRSFIPNSLALNVVC